MKKDARGGKRERAGRRVQNDPLNSFRQIKSKSWIAEVIIRAGSYSDLVKAFDCKENIYRVSTAANTHEDDSVFPTKASIDGYLNGSHPTDRFIENIDALFPGTAAFLDNNFPIWEAIENKEVLLSNIDTKYKCNEIVFSKGYSEDEFDDYHSIIFEDIKSINCDILSKKKLWHEIFNNTFENEIDIIKLPKIVCDNLPQMNYASENSYYIPFDSKDFLFEFNFNDFNPFNQGDSKYDLLIHQIKLYIDNKMLLPEEGFLDVLSIDVAMRKNKFSLRDADVLKLPYGIQKIYNELKETVKIYEVR